MGWKHEASSWGVILLTEILLPSVAGKIYGLKCMKMSFTLRLDR